MKSIIKNMESISVLPTISVIVITYNQEITKLIKTLDSIVTQQGIDFEIIICDDGSRKQYKEELKSYFSQKSFYNYNLVFHKQNAGTVSNYYSGLQVAKGEYTKLISPGDCLTEKNTLYKWVKCLRESNKEWSFSDAYYYYIDNGTINYRKAKAMPQIIFPYIHNNRFRCIWNYTALEDIANGAAIIGTTRSQRYYCRMIKDKGIKYCEDYLYRIMMFHGIVGSYFPEAAICYEYGTGVSTSGDIAWKDKLKEDSQKLVQILRDEKNISDQQKRIVDTLIKNSSSNKLNKIFIRGKLLLWIKRRFFPRWTPVPEKLSHDYENT